MIRTLLFAILISAPAFSQGYTSYFTGNTTNISTIPEYGVCMMGGATEHDNAMIWLLEKANGGDVVVLRASGSDGYNDYLYSELGVAVNSVETLVITSVEGATNPYVLDKVANAEMIWFAGGDQWNYVSFFKNNALEDLLNAHINVKLAPIGGTSAGMAILGGKYFSAQNGSVTSAEALSNPFHSSVTLEVDDFLSVPNLTNVITDTHYDNPDRRGRHMVFLARLSALFSTKGIACNEYVAVCIDQAGKARVFGDYPNYEEFAYFATPNCHNLGNVETLAANTPLTWNFSGEAVKVYKVPGTMNGEHYFDISNWTFPVGSGGSWENWSVVSGGFNASPGAIPNCVLDTPEMSAGDLRVSPNPFSDRITFSDTRSMSVEVFDGSGKKISEALANGFLDTTELPTGIYIMKTTSPDGKTTARKMIKR